MSDEKPSFSEATIVIPTLNEEKNIGKLLGILERNYPSVSIIVVDDGSTDKTQAIVQDRAKKYPRIKLIDRSKKTIKGLTASVIEGIGHATTKYSVVIDADLQHPPEKIKGILYHLEHGYDLVAGYREKIGIEWPWYRKIITKTGTALGKLRLRMKGVVCKDILSGYFGVKTSLFKSVIHKGKDKFELGGYKVLFDLLKQLDKTTKIKNFPFTFDVRKEGQSKLTGKIMLRYFKSIFR